MRTLHARAALSVGVLALFASAAHAVKDKYGNEMGGSGANTATGMNLEGDLSAPPDSKPKPDFEAMPWPKIPGPEEKPDLPPEPPIEAPTEAGRDRAAERARAGEEVIYQYPPDPVSSGRLAREYLKAGDPSGAKRILDRLIDAGEGDADAYKLRSAAQIQEKAWPGAYSDARQALAMAPGDKLASDLAGTAKMEMQRLGLKAPDVKQTKLREPEPDEARRRQAAETAAQAAPQGAAQESRLGSGPVPLLGSVGTGGDPRQALFAGIDRKLALGALQEASLRLTQYLDSHPDDPAAWAKRAYVLNHGNNPKAALADAERALALAPGDPAALREKAYALIQLGRVAEALPILETVIGLQPNNALGYLYRAMARHALGEREAALADYQRAASLDPALQSYLDAALAQLKGAPKKSVGTSANWPVRGLVGAVALALLLAGLWNGLRSRSGQTTRGGETPSRPAVAPGPAETLVAGNMLGGLYRVGRVLGRGGMGVVFEAWDQGLERNVAIKQLRTPEGAQEDYDRFLKEARLVARLQHPNIVQIHSLVEDNSLLYLVFELVEGKALDAVLAQKGRLTPEETLGVVRDVCAALDCAHEARIIHRDLKPSNIMATSKGGYKVMDFGIAHQAQSELMLTQTGAWGTPPYMAPEQERGLVSRESDLYALGCTVYELMTGGRPFGPGADKTTQSFKRVSSLVPSLTPLMDSFMAQALAADPAFRFHTGREFAEAFESCLTGRITA